MVLFVGIIIFILLCLVFVMTLVDAYYMEKEFEYRQSLINYTGEECPICSSINNLYREEDGFYACKDCGCVFGYIRRGEMNNE